jgi:hypothetical protein
MKKLAIPIMSTKDPAMDQFCQAVKSNIDAITGQHRNAESITPLASTATTADIITFVNKLAERLQA